MPRHMYVALAALTLLGSPAMAQTVTDPNTQSTMAPTPPPPPPPQAPPEGTLSITRDTHSVDAYGNRVDSRSTTYRDSAGVAQDKQTTTTTVAPPPPPPPPMVSTTTTTTRTTTVPQ